MTSPIETILGHEFARADLLREAMTHRSALYGRRRRRAGPSNERMEFIGDRVLGLLIAEWLVERFPGEQEGALASRLAQLVSQPVVATIAKENGLGDALSIAPNEDRAGVRRRATVLADALEAAIGALYTDGGLGPARAFVRRVWAKVVEEQQEPPKNPKSVLHEWAMARALGLPEYAIETHSGPPHSPRFVINVTVGGLTGTGSAGSKRAAEQLAAEDLLRALGAPVPRMLAGS